MEAIIIIFSSFLALIIIVSIWDYVKNLIEKKQDKKYKKRVARQLKNIVESGIERKYPLFIANFLKRHNANQLEDLLVYQQVEFLELTEDELKEKESVLKKGKEKADLAYRIIKNNKKGYKLLSLQKSLTGFYNINNDFIIDNQELIECLEQNYDEEYQNYLTQVSNKIKKGVEQFSKCNGVYHYYFLNYYSEKTFLNIDYYYNNEQARHCIWAFKDGKFKYKVDGAKIYSGFFSHLNWQTRTNGKRILNMKIDTGRFDDIINDFISKINHLFQGCNLTLVCVPASNKVSNQIRYKKFMEYVCNSTSLDNSYEHISIIKEKTPKHLGGTDDMVYQLDADYFQGKQVIIFDDLWTTGSSILKMKRLLENLGAKVVCAVTLGKTMYTYNKELKHPYDIEKEEAKRQREREIAKRYEDKPLTTDKEGDKYVIKVIKTNKDMLAEVLEKESNRHLCYMKFDNEYNNVLSDGQLFNTNELFCRTYGDGRMVIRIKP